jgi:diguanylate cyclase (GGDEF)-like protein
MTRSPPHPRALGFSLALGVLGWAVLIAGSWIPQLAVAPPATDVPAAFVLFLVVILAARSLAFRPVPERVLALDAGYYVAAVVCLGSLPAGRLVAIALTLDSLLRLALARRPGRVQESRGDAVGYAFYFGGMTGALIMGCGRLFDVDHVDLVHTAPGAITLLVFGVGAAVLVTHYALQGARAVLTGRSLRAYLRGLALPGMLSEASLLPLGAVLVLLYRPDHLLGFVLLSATYVLITFVFNRLSRASAALRRRVDELEILNFTARRLAASLELGELVETVARETTRAIPEAEVLALAHRGAGGGGDRLVVDGYDRERDTFSRLYVGRGEGATGWVMEHQTPLTIAELADSEVDLGPAGTEGVRSWLGVPIFMYGGCEGVLAVQSRSPGAFGSAERRLLEAISLQVASALQNAHLYEMAMVDGLTGLFVRRYFDARIEDEIERSKRYGQPFSVVMMDIDDFKHLNDSHGHQVGDQVLRAVAQIVKSQMRGVDTATRYGGEEIALVLPRTEMIAAYNQAERIRVAIAEHRVAVDGGSGPAIGVTASFGISAHPESGASSAEELVKRADRALYRAKRTGKNRVELYWGEDTGKLAALAEVAPSPS